VNFQLSFLLFAHQAIYNLIIFQDFSIIRYPI